MTRKEVLSVKTHVMQILLPEPVPFDDPKQFTEFPRIDLHMVTKIYQSYKTLMTMIDKMLNQRELYFFRLQNGLPYKRNIILYLKVAAKSKYRVLSSSLFRTPQYSSLQKNIVSLYNEYMISDQGLRQMLLFYHQYENFLQISLTQQNDEKFQKYFQGIFIIQKNWNQVFQTFFTSILEFNFLLQSLRVLKVYSEYKKSIVRNT